MALFSENAAWPSHGFVSQPPTFTVPVFQYNKTGTTDPGNLVLSAGGKTCLIASDEGELLWRLDDKTPFVTNCLIQKLNGTDVIVYNEAYFTDQNVGFGYGTVVIRDSTYQVIHNVTLKDPELTNSRDGDWASVIDYHESTLTEEDTVLVVAYNATQLDLSPFGGPLNGWVHVPLIYELDVKSNDIVYRWDVMENVPLQSSHAFFGGVHGTGATRDKVWDPYHVNSIQPYKNGFLFSIRNAGTAIYVNKATGEIEWTLDGVDRNGDFKIDGDEQTWFNWQHHIRIQDNVHNDRQILTVFNNFNDEMTGRNESRGVIIDLDLHTMRGSKRGTFLSPEHPVYAWNSGSVHFDQITNHTIVNYGSGTAVMEFDADANPIYRLEFGNPVEGYSYRTMRTLWKGYPKTKPSVRACGKDGELKAYMSWNGASELVKWNVYAGMSAETMDISACLDKTGFETEAAIPDDSKFIRVDALDGDDNVLASSSTVPTMSTC
ncbi:hypothetical protein VHEMI03177 [[Torrubiella] hemipterigena]|uniref:ASST-domain-containing protein n=1 Tax=[Torrubiella] hemipterigena TaxID=1531966 RepID=A0A0A1TAH4_9HYPO|nr:hypothetical protein VHEMI03177 [[Torrubiella] hemipterigena]